MVKKKDRLKKSQSRPICQICGIQIQKEMKSTPKQPSCKKKDVALKKAMVKKRCEIQGGGQEMAVMVG